MKTLKKFIWRGRCAAVLHRYGWDWRNAWIEACAADDEDISDCTPKEWAYEVTCCCEW